MRNIILFNPTSIFKIRDRLKQVIFVTTLMLTLNAFSQFNAATNNANETYSEHIISAQYNEDKTPIINEPFHLDRLFLAPPVVDLNGPNVAGTDISVISPAGSPTVYPTVAFDAFVSSDTNALNSATITISGVVDSEFVGIQDDISTNFTFFDLSTSQTVNINQGGVLFQVQQTTTTFTITNSAGGTFSDASISGLLQFFYYGDITDPGATEGPRTMTVTVTDSMGTSPAAVATLNVHYLPTAVDDTNSIAANAVTPVSGDVLSNDTDATPGDVLSVGEVDGYAGSVGNSYTTTYGAIVINANGTYDYTVDVNNITVRGLTNGTSIDDIIAYQVVDLVGNVDYGYLTVTINGVDDLPDATDNNVSVTAFDPFNNTASGNVIFDDSGSGPDFTDRITTVLVWENEFTDLEVTSGQNRTVGGVTTTFTTSDPDAVGVAGVHHAVSHGTNGGHTGYLVFNIDPATNPVTTTTMTMDFSTPVANLQFRLSDIDYSQGTFWQDLVTINATLGGTVVPFNAQISGSIVDAGSNTYYGTGSVPPDDAHGNITISFAEPIDQLVLGYNYGPATTEPDPGGQIAGVSDLYWQNLSGTTVTAVDGLPAFVGIPYPTTYGTLTLNADGSYTYVLDQTNPAVIALAPGGTLTDTIGYTITDAALNSDSANLIVTINGPLDNDGDGIADVLDIDDDNDGIADTDEGEGLNNATGDEDGDGIPNFLDVVDDGNGGDGSITNYMDSNGDGIPDVFDTDSDGIPNNFDLDSDNDGILDVDEGGDGALDTNGDGMIDANDAGFTDTLMDGQADASEGTSEPDTDSDTVPDYLDLDSDNDGINDVDEDGQGAFDTNNDGIVDGADNDNDGIIDTVDANSGTFGEGPGGEPSSTDTDGDGVPDYRDLDSDNDGINDTIEGGNDAADTNGDGVIDSNDTGGADADGDGISDSVDGNSGNYGDQNDPNHQDSDSDGIPDSQDLDSDDDGIVDVEEGNNGDADTNDDGTIDTDDVGGGDADGDGIPDSVDEDPGNYGDAGNDDDPANNTSDPTDPNSGGSGTLGDSGSDNDGDGIADSVDNCDNVDGTPEFGLCDTTLSSDDVVVANNEFVMYPNPANNMLTLQFTSNHQVGNITFYSITGQEIMKNVPQLHNNETAIDISNLSSGVYIVKVMVNDNVISRRLIVE